MTEGSQTIVLGAARVSVIDVYDIPSNLEELIDAPLSERSPQDAATMGQIAYLPVQCILVQLPEMTVLVDAGAYERAYDQSGRPDYQPPLSLLDRLNELGVQPADVDHVVITHAHGDHFNATTTERDGEYDPMFPEARHHVGRADWEGMREALLDPVSLETRTFGVLEREELLDLVDAVEELGEGVAILAAPGETPGHQIVVVRSEGEALYCIGDLYHHPIEVEHPSWMVRWADRDKNLASRNELAQNALAENAMLVATHIPGVGRLGRTATSVEWLAL